MEYNQKFEIKQRLWDFDSSWKLIPVWFKHNKPDHLLWTHIPSCMHKRAWGMNAGAYSVWYGSSDTCQMTSHRALILFLMSFLTNRTLWGGGRSAPLAILLLECIFFSFNRGLVLDLKGQNPKTQPSILKIVPLRKFEN